MEEQQHFEVQEREKVEINLRNLELENTKLVNNLKQVTLLSNLLDTAFIILLIYCEYCAASESIILHYLIIN